MWVTVLKGAIDRELEARADTQVSPPYVERRARNDDRGVIVNAVV
jgi:hypothetical protein